MSHESGGTLFDLSGRRRQEPAPQSGGAAAEFDGKTYEPEHDRERLRSLLVRVRALMSDGRWRTLLEIMNQTGGTETSVSARLRDLRKPKFGGYQVNKRRIKNRSGLFEYQVQRGGNEQ